MDIKYTEIELKALDDKAMNPDAVVLCPRCGKELTFRSFGSSYVVNCPTDNCLKETARGL